jgi:dynein heavy chain 1
MPCSFDQRFFFFFFFSFLSLLNQHSRSLPPFDLQIRGAIQEYQAQLLQRVKQDIEALHEKFKQKYKNSEAFHMSGLRDLPPVSGAIIWGRQLERQLNMELQRVEHVLGKRWELDPEGQKLKADSENFKKKLNAEQVRLSFRLPTFQTTATTIVTSSPLFPLRFSSNG